LYWSWGLDFVLKLGIYTPTYPGVRGDGGIGTYTQALARGIAKLGSCAHVLLPGSGLTVSDGLVQVHPVKVRHLPVLDRIAPGAGASWRVGRAMARLVRGFGLNVVEFPNWEGLSLWFALGRRVPLVVRLHTSSSETIEIDRLPMDRLRRADICRERWTARMADVLVTHSSAHRRAMSVELGIDDSRIHIVPHGIERAAQDRLPVPREENTVVYLGRLERRKGTLDLLHTIPAVLRECPTVRFVFIGADRAHCPGGRTHAQYVAEEFAPPVRQRITLTGRLPDSEVEGWLRRATVFVAPSLYESFGLIFLEAMRWGTPVIGTLAGGIPEVVEDGRSGLLVPPSDPSALAAAIVGLLRNRELRETLGRAGRERCECHFSVDRMATQMLDLYEEAIARFRR
jgi:glycosyltransferase involved in cell wall biosynthesis